MSESKLPPLDKELVDRLNVLYPERCPSVKDSDRDIWVYAGKRELVRWINEQYRRQQESDLVL